MKRLFAPLVVLAALAGLVAGCGTTPEPTAPPPTQTPWYIIVTATPEPDTVAEVEPTPVVVTVVVTATPTRTRPTATTGAAGTTESPEGTLQPPATPAPRTPTSTTPAPPTLTPEPVAIKYPAPALSEPPNNQPVTWRSTVLLVWLPVGELASDEYYHVHLERPPKTEGEQWYGDYVFVKDTEYLLERTFLAPFHLAQEHGHAVVYWWVRVVRQTGTDENGKPLGVDIGQPSEKRTLILEPRP